MKVFRIPGDLATLNEYTFACRSNRFTGASIKKRQEKVIRHAIRYQLLGYKFKEPVYVWFHWICKNKRKDRDNISFAKKFIFDAMVEEAVIPDDGWDNVLGYFDSYGIDKDRPCIIVEIYRADEWPLKEFSDKDSR